MKKINLLKKSLVTGVIALFCMQSGFISNAQVIRPYGSIYSNTLKGGHTIFGNTITGIYSSGSGSTGAINTTAMNDFGTYSNGTTSGYGNDNSNIQLMDVDGAGTAVTLISSGDNWNYSTTAAQPAGWPSVTSLPGGPSASPLAYGPTGTAASTLPDLRTYYFTRTINISNTGLFTGFTFNLMLDDGAVVYVNGTEVGRINMNSGTPSYTTDAAACAEPEQTGSFTTGTIAPFVNGNNTIQVEVHTCASNESGTDDLFFDLELVGNPANISSCSSSADLVLPSGINTIKFARLYWGGRISSGDGGAANINLRTVKIRKGISGSYTTLVTAATAVDKTLISGSTDTAYQSYVDVTGLVSTGGAGTFTVADIKAAVGSTANGGHYAGWSIVVVYENPALPYSSVRVYDGFIQVYNGGNPVNQSVVLTGLNVPSNPLLASDAYMSVMTWEGDANLAASSGNPNGDYLKINGITVSNAVNPAVNMWNGTISKNGAFISTKNPDFKNQMGIDLDEIEVGTGYGILGNATSVAIEFGTEADQYFPSLFAFTMKAKDPAVLLDKTVADAHYPYQVLQPDELLTYTLSGSNQGPGAAYNSTVTDSIPGNITYEPNTMKVLYSPGFANNTLLTDAADGDAAVKACNGTKHYVKFHIGTGANAETGGVLQPGETYAVSFKARTSSIPIQVTEVFNTARITALSVTGELFTDDGSINIGPSGGPVAVKLVSFDVKKEGSNARLQWVTAAETRNDHFDIERSKDAMNFKSIGSLPGQGTSSLNSSYTFTDPLQSVNSKIVYYRLRVVDQDGKSSFSKVVAIRTDGTSISNYAIYPNPFSNEIKLQISSSKEEKITIRFLNPVGQQLLQRSISLQPGENIILLKDLDVLKTGLNIIEINTSDQRITERIIKN